MCKIYNQDKTANHNQTIIYYALHNTTQSKPINKNTKSRDVWNAKITTGYRLDIA